MRTQKGFTITELSIVTVVISILALVALPLSAKIIESHRVEVTVKEMQAIAAAAEIARNMPGGDGYENVDTATIFNLLAAYGYSSVAGLTSEPKRNYWGGTFMVTTQGKAAKVTTTIPVGKVNPFGANATSSDSQSTLSVSHRGDGSNYGAAMRSVSNKTIMYLEAEE